MRNTSFALVLIAALAAGAAALTAQSKSPVADAAERRDAASVQALVAKGADVNAAQGDGMTALHWSAMNGDLKTMNVLLIAGATPDPLTRIGRYTPLHLASSKGQAAVVARLLDAGASSRAATSTGVQPIHLAAEAGSAEAVKALLDHGADVNARDDTHGRTPLVFAVSQNRLDAMKVLLARGADVRLTTKVIDYVARSAEDNAARTARDRAITAATGRATNS